MTKPIVRDHLVKVRVTEDECEKLIKAAERKGLTVSSWLRMIALAAAVAGCGGAPPADKLEARPQVDAADPVADAGKKVDAAEARDLESMPVDMSQAQDMAQTPDLAPMCIANFAPCQKNDDCCAATGLPVSASNIYASCNQTIGTNLSGLCFTTFDLNNCFEGGRESCYVDPIKGVVCEGC